MCISWVANRLAPGLSTNKAKNRRGGEALRDAVLAKGVDLELETGPPDTQSDPNRKRCPTGKIPLIEDGDVLL
jgi:hypothetical protein